jgi:excisionase family DNA binding protein
MTYQEMPELLTIKQASQLINVHPNTLRNWERDGKISAVRIGSRRDRRFHKQTLWSMSQTIITGLTQGQSSLNTFSQQYR